MQLYFIFIINNNVNIINIIIIINIHQIMLIDYHLNTTVARQGINEVLGNACDGREGGMVSGFAVVGHWFLRLSFRSLPAWFQCDHIKSNR